MLPSGFPGKDLSPTDLSKVEWYYSRYVEDYYSDYYYGHFLMAAYAAVPGLLTPDLLYKIWQNFNGYHWNGAPATIHRIAVADVLLSPLCREVGFELYEMQHEIRLAMLEWLSKESAGEKGAKRGFKPIEKIADFLQEYYQKPNSGGQIWGEQYLETQQLEALSYADPLRVAETLKYKMRHAASEKSETDFLRAMDQFNKTFHRLQRVLPKDQQQVLDIYAEQNKSLEAGRALIQQHTDGFRALMDSLEDIEALLSENSEDGIPVKIDASLMEKQEDDAPPKILALIVGVETESFTSEKRENDAALMAECLRSLLPSQQGGIQVLSGEKATRENILKVLSDLTTIAREQDHIFIYFSCNARKEGSNCYLLCASGDGISYNDLRAATGRIHGKQTLLVLEAPFSGSPQWMDIEKENTVAIIASAAADQSPVNFENALIDGKQYSFFTYELARQLKRKKGYVSIRELMRLTVKGFEAMPQLRAIYSGKSYRDAHRPQLFASPYALDAVFIPNGYTAMLQTSLRQEGFFDGPTTGLRDVKLEQSIRAYEEEAYHGNADEMGIVLRLSTRKLSKKKKPVFLLVFSDPHKTLVAIQREKEHIEALLRPRVEQAGIELLILTDPDIAELTALFKDREYRNRIELFHYSGVDDEGGMVLADDTFTIFDFVSLLEYQDELHLLISNTCNSKYFAELACQMGIRMTVGSEKLVRDDFGADFGIAVFDAIIQRKQLFKLDPHGGYLQNITTVKDADSFRCHAAPWYSYADIRDLPWDLSEQKVTTEKRPQLEPASRIHAVILGLTKASLEEDVEKFHYHSNENVMRFYDWLHEYRNVTGVNLNIVNESSGLTRERAMAMLDTLGDARDGDTCIFFYSGITFTGIEGSSFQDCIFEDDSVRRFANVKDFDRSLYVWERLNSVLAGKKVHLLVITDIHAQIRIKEYQKETVAIGDVNTSSLVILQSPPGSSKTGGWESNDFFESLDNVLRSSNKEITYKELFEGIKVRLSQTREKDEPYIITAPSQAINYVILNEREKINLFYKVVFDLPSKQWRVNAGRRNGVRPSLSFMRTLFRLTGVNELAAVSDVFEEYAVLDIQDELDTTREYLGELIQNALPKVKIAYDPAINPEMREDLNRAIRDYDIYYIDIVERVQQAKFIIRNRDWDFYLSRNSFSGNTEFSTEPVFNHQPRAFEFIKQMEYVAQWQGVLEFDNGHTGISKDCLNLEFEVFRDELNSNAGSGERILNPPILVLQSKDITSQIFRCGISLAPTAHLQHYYAAALFLDSSFGIFGDFRLLELKRNANNWLALDLSNAVVDNETELSININNEIWNSKKEDYSYLKIFISDSPINLKPFAQEELKYTEEVTRSLGADRRRRAVELFNNVWTSLTIPIKVTWGQEEEANFRQKVMYLYKERKVLVPDDLQKSRWGGKSKVDGKELMVHVRKNILPWAYDVSIVLDVDYKGLKENIEVAFFLHDTFDDEIRFKPIKGGIAQLSIKAYEAFTVGAYMEDGTMLELDMNEVPGLPEGFYYKDVSEEFKSKVKETYDSRPVMVKDDLQKGRWGGKSKNRGKKLEAKVGKGIIPGYYQVRLGVSSDNDTPLTGDVAFFLHDSFPQEIRYSKATNNSARITVSAYEAFVVGAYTEDGTMLELDLNKVTGAPEGFYY